MNRFRLVRDERELNVDQAADRLSYLVLSFGLLLLVAWRSVSRNEASWDLLGLVIIGGLAGTGYRLRGRVVSRQRWRVAVLTTGLALAVAIVVVLAARP